MVNDKNVLWTGPSPRPGLFDMLKQYGFAVCFESNPAAVAKWLPYTDFGLIVVETDNVKTFSEIAGAELRNEVRYISIGTAEFSDASANTWFTEHYPGDEMIAEKIVEMMARTPGLSDNLLTLQRDELLGILDISPDTVLLVDRNGIIRYASKMAAAMFGYSPAEMVGLQGEILVPEELRERHVAHRERHWSNPAPKRMGGENENLNARRKDGSTFQVEITLNIISIKNQPLTICFIRDVSRQAESQKLLEHNRQYIDNIISLVPGAIYHLELGPGGSRKVLYLSNGLTELLNVQPIDLINSLEYYIGRIHPDDLKNIEAVLAKSYAEKKEFEFEFRVYSLIDDSIIWLFTSAKPNTEDGVNYTWTGIMTDVTEIHTSHQMMALQQHAIENAHVGIVITSLKPDTGRRTIDYVNHEYTKLTGYTAEEAIGSESALLTGADTSPETIKMLMSSLQDGKAFKSELKSYRKDGSWFWNYLVISPIKDKSGPANQTIGIINDITEKKNAELQTAYNLYLFTTVIQNMHSGLLIVDKDFRVIAINSRFCTIFGITAPPEKMIGSEFVLTPQQSKDRVENPDAFMKRLTEMITERIPAFQEEIKLKNGNIYLRDYIPLFDDHTKNFIGHLIQYHDITMLKQAEEKLKERNEQLSLANSELDRFVYSISHELRGPLTTLMGLVNIAEIDITGPEKLKLFHMMHRSLDKIDFFIKNIMVYSQNNRSTLAGEPVDLFDLVDETVQMIVNFNKAQIEIRVTGDDRFPLVTDKERLSIIIRNLVSNAIMFINPREKHPFVHISAVCSAEKADITVADNGIGIDNESIDKIFNMFYRGSELSTGTGMGLYIVKEVLRKMGGEIIIESEPGAGTLVKITIPNMGYHD